MLFEILSQRHRLEMSYSGGCESGRLDSEADSDHAVPGSCKGGVFFRLLLRPQLR